jgi:hypothetical protein
MRIMQYQININIAVDVIKALSDKTLEENIVMMDDSRMGSTGQGTPMLATCCKPGQAIRWVVYAVDLQTSVSIKRISFYGSDQQHSPAAASGIQEVNPDAKEWTGIVPCMERGRPHRYRLELQMGKGEYSVMAIETPSIVWPCA